MQTIVSNYEGLAYSHMLFPASTCDCVRAWRVRVCARVCARMALVRVCVCVCVCVLLIFTTLYYVLLLFTTFYYIFICFHTFHMFLELLNDFGREDREGRRR